MECVKEILGVWDFPVPPDVSATRRFEAVLVLRDRSGVFGPADRA